MRRSEFLEQLKTELEGTVPGAVVHEKLDYYTQYIAEQIAGGTPEEQVIEELGDPWIIARNIIADYERRHSEEAAREEQARRDAQTDRDYAMNQRKGGAFSYIMVLVIAVLVILLIVSAVAGTMIILLRQLPLIFIIVVVVWIVHRIRN